MIQAIDTAMVFLIGMTVGTIIGIALTFSALVVYGKETQKKDRQKYGGGAQ